MKGRVTGALFISASHDLAGQKGDGDLVAPKRAPKGVPRENGYEYTACIALPSHQRSRVGLCRVCTGSGSQTVSRPSRARCCHASIASTYVEFSRNAGYVSRIDNQLCHPDYARLHKPSLGCCRPPRGSRHATKLVFVSHRYSLPVTSAILPPGVCVPT